MTKPTINDARWQEWTDKFLAAECVDPGADKTGMIMGFFTLRREMSEEERDELQADFSSNFAFQVAKLHADRIGLKLDDEGMQFISIISENLGSIVMNIHAARRLQQKLGVEELTTKQLFTAAFADGLRSDDVLQALWEEQKVTLDERKLMDPDEEIRMDNYLDYIGV